MKKLRNLFMIISLLLITLLVACKKDDQAAEVSTDEAENDNVTESGMPIVNEPITLNFFTNKSNQNYNNDWQSLYIWEEYEDLTNIKIEWEQVHNESLEEKRNLALASGDLPDAFYASNIPPLDLLRYGEQGVLIPLNELIEEHAPNIRKIFEEQPEVKDAITFPDGNIYSLPVIEHPDFISMSLGASPLFHRKWVEKLGVPETTDEFYEYLKAIQDQSDDVPFGTLGMDHLVSWLEGSFGVANRGIDFIDLDPETEALRFYPITEGYKEMLQYINKLYEEELIEQNIFTIEHPDYLVNNDEEIYGSTYYWPSDEWYDKYEPGIALEGPHGDQQFPSVGHTISVLGQFSITKDNDNPVETIRWVDYFYSDEGNKLFYLGIEGETFEERSDGTLRYMDHIIDVDELTENEAISKHFAWIGTNGPGARKMDYYHGSESSKAAIEAAEKMEPYFIDPEEKWPVFLFTEEESKELDALKSDIEKYVEEMRDQFISGNKSFSEWDDFVKTINNMGLDRYMEIQEQAYKRYIEN